MCNCNVHKDCDDFGDDDDNGDDAHLLIACKEAAVRAGQLCTSSSRSWVCRCSFFIILGLLYFVFVYVKVAVNLKHLCFFL